jgi:GrpB-like predicted nucleotidyltransferase (UPF0157 family)/GNAT superfamily N-acetyltransferase
MPAGTPVTLIDHQPGWAAEFEALAQALRDALGPLALQVDHIGSTAVPGLCAKDVLDVQVTVAALSPELGERLQAAGFVWQATAQADHVPPGENPAPEGWRKLLFKNPPGQRRAHIHLRVQGAPNQRYALLFRDFLRNQPAMAQAYGELKRRLATTLADPGSYAEVKDPAVDLIYLAARQALAFNPATAPATLFASADLQARALRAHEVPALQALYAADPAYFQRVAGRPARPDEARRDFEESPPTHLGYRERWFLGVFDGAGQLQGVVDVVADLCAEGVWHIALVFLAQPLRGTGAAARLHAALESWAQAAGARWLRLGVVRGNTSAERHWHKLGFREVRTRETENASGQPATIGVLVKPLAGGDLAQYLRLLPRDAPGSLLP